MSLNHSTSRTALGVISNNKINISNNNSNDHSSSYPLMKSHYHHSTPVRPKLDDLSNNHYQKIQNFKKRHLDDNNNDNDNDNDNDGVSPKLKRARLLKMKLQLAYFKVKTDQTDTLLNDLKLPSHSSSIFNLQKIQTSSTTKPLSKRSTKRNSRLKNLKKTKMDDIVTKKGVCANLKRSNQEFANSSSSSSSSSSVPSSAPPNLLHFNHLQNNLNFSSVSVTSPSKFAISSIDKKRVKLPPLPKLLAFTNQNQNVNANSDSNIFHLSQQSLHYNNDTTIDEKEISVANTIHKHSNNHSDTTILQNESTSTPLVRRRHSIDQIERTDPDLTILQNNSILMSTPVRRTIKKASSTNTSNTSNTSKLNNEPSSKSIPTDFTTPLSKKKLSSSSFNDSKKKSTNGKQNSILKDDDETQLMSSPTRLLSTPSSIGAAKCLLQLAHR